MTIFSCFERFLGFLYRIFLSRKLGAEGIGMYQITLSVVGVLVTLTASGTPITVSRLMMKARAKNDITTERDVISAGILTSLILSLPLTIVLYLFRGKLSFIFADSRCYDVLAVILPGVVLTSVYAVIRGVFWGNKNFLTYSLIELIEEIVMLVFGVILVSQMTSVADGTIRAGYAILISYVVSFLLSTTVFIIKGGRLTNPIRQLPPLVEASLPITIMRTAMSLLGSVVAIIIPARLVAFGSSSEVALARFGELSGMAFPLLFIPSTLIGSIALVLVPELAENFYKRQNDALSKKISGAIKCSVVISCLIFPVFFACGEEIGIIIYSNQNAGRMLTYSAIIMLPMSITMITTSILNSLNLEKKTLAIYLLGSAFMLACVWFLPKFCGVSALIWGHFFSYFVSTILNLALLEKLFSKKLEYKKSAFLTFGCAILSCCFGYFARGIFVEKMTALPLCLIVSAATLLFDLIVMKIVGVLDIGAFIKKEIKV